MNGLPHNDDAERAILGAVLVDPSLIPKTRRALGVLDLYLPRHRLIYQAVLDLEAVGSEPDLVMLKAELERRGQLEKCGGPAYLGELTQGVPRSGNVEHYAELVRDPAHLRRMAGAAQAVADECTNGADPVVIRETLAVLNSEAAEFSTSPQVVDLFSEQVTPTRPEFVVANLIRKTGLHLVWAQPGGWKTTLLLRAVLELLKDPPSSSLWGVPQLAVRSAWRRVLWIATEETAGALRYRANAVRRGLGDPTLAGELLHVFAADRHRVTLTDLPALVEQYHPLDAVVLDSLTGLRPKVVQGERVKWDADNDAANELCLNLRGLSAEHQLAVLMVHHSEKTGQNYRGPTDWWASADVMIGLRPEDGAVKVEPQKNRDGRLLDPFRLLPSWDGDSFNVELGATPIGELSENAKLIRTYMRGVGRASQASIEKETGLAHGGTVHRAVQQCVDAEIIEPTGETENKSRVFKLTVQHGPTDADRTEGCE